ncbi:helix-turn-helix transcriptional regulator [Psychromicrobium sp. YIM B11713]|uniref:helix-turn-helix transcriptional regulator n=1 Tax=Psychromicrobium sp. YIM B11713 TaxID=3145233 RepID=UPI00374F5ED9
MSASRTERLLNLLIALLETRYGRSKEFLRRNIQAYRESPSEEAFERMFERDKVDLRAMGIPLETYHEPGAFEEDLATTHYRIPKDKYRLPEIRFSVEEAAVLSLAARLWDRAALGTAAARAVRKIETRGGLPEDFPVEPLLEPRVSTREPAFEELLEAVTARVEVAFDYQGTSDQEPRRRRVQPWGLGQKYGHWYLVGQDIDRQQQRVFRLSRISGAIEFLNNTSFERPAEFSVVHVLDGMKLPAQQSAEVAIRQSRGQALRERGEQLGAEDGWDVFKLSYSSLQGFAAELAGWGPQVVVRTPEVLARAVQSKLTAVLEAEELPVPSAEAVRRAPRQSRGKTTAQDHLRRLVDLVPFLVHHQGMHLDEIAAEFGINRRQLEADLSLMMVSGLPGGLHGDLMDVSWDDGHVYIADAEELSQPVRFSLDEASALLVGLETLSALPGLDGESAVRTAMAKISAATGEAASSITSTVGVRLAPMQHGDSLELLQKAVREKRQLKLSYLVPHRDEITERLVDPIRVFSNDQAWYLQAWCHSAEAQRIFRIDRIRGAELAGNIENSVDSAFPESLFTPGAQDSEVTLLLQTEASWVADYYEAQSVQQIVDGAPWSYLVTIRVGNVDWLPQLVAQNGGAVRLLAPQQASEAALNWVRDAVANYA